jgi:putative hemolysin
MTNFERLLDISRSFFGLRRATHLEVGLAVTPSQVQMVRRFRIRSGSEFERAGEHFFVYDHGAKQVCGTLRFWDPSAANSLTCDGLGQCFDMQGLRLQGKAVVEVGRFYLHPDYPASMVSRMLWKAVCAEFRERKLQCMLGSVTVSTQDGGHHAAAIFRTLSRRYLAEPELRATPLRRLPLEVLYANCDPVIPPRIKEYLKLGGLLAAEPHLQPEQALAEFLFYLPATKIQLKPGSPSVLAQSKYAQTAESICP